MCFKLLTLLNERFVSCQANSKTQITYRNGNYWAFGHIRSELDVFEHYNLYICKHFSLHSEGPIHLLWQRSGNLRGGRADCVADIFSPIWKGDSYTLHYIVSHTLQLWPVKVSYWLWQFRHSLHKIWNEYQLFHQKTNTLKFQFKI